MRLLIVIDHPDPQSFTHATAQSFADGAQSTGAEIEIADLHAEGFSPVWMLADQRQYDLKKTPEDVLQEQSRLECADALCLVFPLYWFGMPAMLKGWIDRVFTFGWAYDQLEHPQKSMLPARHCTLLIPAAGNPNR
ncbi:MAG: NAD(P)H-dependent oxidoreductase [Pseudomonadota bacterium]